jgi:hypothetical protein
MIVLTDRFRPPDLGKATVKYGAYTPGMPLNPVFFCNEFQSPTPKDWPVIAYHDPDFYRLPEELQSIAVTHELAHAYLHARGNFPHTEEAVTEILVDEWKLERNTVKALEEWLSS